MKNLQNNPIIAPMSTEDAMNQYGGGEWKLGEAVIAYLLLGGPGVLFYTLGTQQ